MPSGFDLLGRFAGTCHNFNTVEFEGNVFGSRKRNGPFADLGNVIAGKSFKFHGWPPVMLWFRTPEAASWLIPGASYVRKCGRIPDLHCGTRMRLSRRRVPEAHGIAIPCSRAPCRDRK